MSEKMASGAAYSTSVATIIAGLTLNDWGIIAGIVGVVGTLAMNAWFKHKDRISLRAEEARREREHAIEMEKKQFERDLLALELQGMKRRREFRKTEPK
jgi:hypothetical protein